MRLIPGAFGVHGVVACGVGEPALRCIEPAKKEDNIEALSLNTETSTGESAGCWLAQTGQVA